MSKMSVTEEVEMLTRHRDELVEILRGEHSLSLEQVGRALHTIRVLSRSLKEAEARMPLAEWEKDLLGI